MRKQHTAYALLLAFACINVVNEVCHFWHILVVDFPFYRSQFSVARFARYCLYEA